MVTYYLDLDELAQSAVKALQACPYTLPKTFRTGRCPKKGHGCKIVQETNNAVKQMAQKIVI